MAKGNKPEKKTAQPSKEAPKVEMKEKDKTKAESSKKGDGVKALKSGDAKASKQTEAAAKRAEAERKEKEAAEAAAAKSAQSKRKRDSSDEDESSSSSESSSSESSSSSSSSSSSAAPPPKKAAATTKDAKPAAKPVAAAKAATPAKKAPAKKDESSSSSSSSSNEEEDKKEDESSSSSSSSSESSSSSSSASEPIVKKGPPAKAAVAAEPAKTKPAAAAAADPSTAGVKRLFLGNCSFDINDDLLKEALGKYGTIESIHWVTDRETGKFYGTGFVEFATADEANAALGADGVEIAGRAVRIQIAKPRANEGKAGAAGGARGGGAGGKPKGKQPLSEKPAGCKTMFIGGLPQTVTEDEVRGLFGDCGEITGIRWVERDGEFKGCGFIEFADTNAVDKAAEKNGTMLGTRSIRVDYAAAKEKKQF